MKVIKRIEIDLTDVSALHAELTDLFGVFADHTPGGEEWVKTEFPTMAKLQRLLQGLVIDEPGERVYERLTGIEGQKTGDEAKSQRRSRFKIVPRD
jgi:hypothetical protein